VFSSGGSFAAGSRLSRRPIGRRPSRARALGLFALLAAGVALFVELASFAALSFLHGGLYGYRQLAAGTPIGGAQLEELQAPAEVALTEPGTRKPVHERVGYGLHPFLGYAREVGVRPFGAGDREPLAALGFEEASGWFVRTPREGELVVGVFGGSVARDFGVGAGARRLAERLRAMPAFAGREITFTVPALSGFKQPQSLLALSYLLVLGAHFDWIVVIDGFNEVALPIVENAPKGVAPFYPRSWYFLAQPVRPDLQAEYAEITAAQRSAEARRSAIHDTPLRFSFAVAAASHAHDAWLARRIGAAKQRLVAERTEPTSSAVTGPRQTFASDEALLRDVVRIWGESSLAMAQLARARGISYLHVLQPNQHDPGSKPLTDAERPPPRAPLDAARKVPIGYPLLRAEGHRLAEQGVAFRDLSGVFRDTRETLYVDVCCHFDDRGHEILADAIAAAIAEQAAGQEAGALATKR
jgi:hypothetical protein